MGERSRDFGADAEINDLSAGGLYLRLARHRPRGEELLLVARVSHALLALRGTILRAERREGGWGVALSVSQHKILSSLRADKEPSLAHEFSSNE